MMMMMMMMCVVSHVANRTVEEVLARMSVLLYCDANAVPISMC